MTVFRMLGMRVSFERENVEMTKNILIKYAADPSLIQFDQDMIDSLRVMESTHCKPIKIALSITQGNYSLTELGEWRSKYPQSVDLLEKCDMMKDQVGTFEDCMKQEPVKSTKK
jgi:hypothetical protein